MCDFKPVYAAAWDAAAAGPRLSLTANLAFPAAERWEVESQAAAKGCRRRGMIPLPMAWYDDNAELLAPRYEALPARELRAWLAHLLPQAPAIVLDIGAGTGRDAAAFAEDGYDVVAVEPSSGMRAVGERLHNHARLRWMANSLPSLQAVLRTGLSADVVILNGVWQHVSPSDRARAFRKLVTVLKPSGLLAITLRHGPNDGRGAHEVSADEIEALARDHGMQVAVRVSAADFLGRPDVNWTQIALRLPDDGTGALPLLRHAILIDQKSSTYKLGLLRSLCRAADGAAGLAEEDGDGHVSLPLGLVALNWLRLYLPLTAADLPQSPTNTSGASRLGLPAPAGRPWRRVLLQFAACVWAPPSDRPKDPLFGVRSERRPT